MGNHGASALTVHDLLDDVELLRIGSVELGALRSNRAQDGVSQNQTIDPDYTLQIYGRNDDQGFRVVLRTELTFDGGRIVSEVEAEYQLNKLLFSQISEATRMEFANEVSIMSILPYTRASIADITIRVFDAALLMPIIERGQITFKTEEAQ